MDHRSSDLSSLSLFPLSKKCINKSSSINYISFLLIQNMYGNEEVSEDQMLPLIFFRIATVKKILLVYMRKQSQLL